MDKGGKAAFAQKGPGDGIMFDTEYMFSHFMDVLAYLPVTVKLTVGALMIAFPLALFFSFVQYKNVPVLSFFVRIYLSVIRGTPVVLQMFVIYGMGPVLLQQYFRSIGKNIDVYAIDNSWYAYAALSLSTTAFLTEAFRSALQSVDPGQKEAGYMVGMKTGQIYKEFILPQAMTVAIPIVGNTIVDTIKASSLAFTMSVTEVMGEAKIIGGMHSRYLEMYVNAFFVYVIFIFLVEFLLKRIERRLTRYRNA